MYQLGKKELTCCNGGSTEDLCSNLHLSMKPLIYGPVALFLPSLSQGVVVERGGGGHVCWPHESRGRHKCGKEMSRTTSPSQARFILTPSISSPRKKKGKGMLRSVSWLEPRLAFWGNRSSAKHGFDQCYSYSRQSSPSESTSVGDFLRDARMRGPGFSRGRQAPGGQRRLIALLWDHPTKPFIARVFLFQSILWGFFFCF